jgi:hypothetical protein
MKKTTKKTLCVWAWLMLLTLEPARAFYDPGTQRWLNRDPVREEGFGVVRKSQREPGPQPDKLRKLVLEGPNTQRFAKNILAGAGENLYAFVRNEPIAHLDSLGLQSICPLPCPPGALWGCVKECVNAGYHAGWPVLCVPVLRGGVIDGKIDWLIICTCI